MAEINVAYDLLRAGASRAPAPPSAPRAPAPRAGGLSDALRRALGPELIDALGKDETVRLVTPASTWTSPRTILAVTDRRLLWLLDDAPVARVRAVPLRDVADVEQRVRRPRRRVATLLLRTTSGQPALVRGAAALHGGGGSRGERVELGGGGLARRARRKAARASATRPCLEQPADVGRGAERARGARRRCRASASSSPSRVFDMPGPARLRAVADVDQRARRRRAASSSTSSGGSSFS